MINPYMPDANKVSYAYNHLINKAEELDGTRKLSLLHPYKTSESVIRAIEQGGSEVDILSKMDPSLRKDPEEMLKIIDRVPSAYAHIHKDIDTKEFGLSAIRANHAVYTIMDQQKRDDPEICDAYREEMLKRMKRMPMDSFTMAMQFEQQFSKNANFDQIFTDKVYEQAFEKMVQDGPYLRDRTLREEFAIVSTARMMRERDIARLDQIERDVWLNNQDKVRELAHGDRRLVVRDNALQAIEERCPELQPEIKKEQKSYWQSRENELLVLKERESDGYQLSGDERRMIIEAQKHIELDERKRRETERIQKERVENNAYFMRSAQDRVYSAADMGDIKFSQAVDIATNIGNTPKDSNASVARTELERGEAIENDIDNHDEGRENYQRVTAGLGSPSMISESVSANSAVRADAEAEAKRIKEAQQEYREHAMDVAEEHVEEILDEMSRENAQEELVDRVEEAIAIGVATGEVVDLLEIDEIDADLEYLANLPIAKTRDDEWREEDERVREEEEERILEEEEEREYAWYETPPDIERHHEFKPY